MQNIKGDTPTIVLLRRDLRLRDNPAIHYASLDSSIILLYVYELSNNDWGSGGASNWWLHHSLHKFTQSVKDLNGDTLIKKGNVYEAICEVAKATGSKKVVWNRRYEPNSIKHDKKLKTLLENDNLIIKSYNASLLSEPWETLNKQGMPYKVFTAYWRQCLSSLQVAQPLPRITKANFYNFNEATELESLSINALNGLDTKNNWGEGLNENWQVGEVAAEEKWHDFINDPINTYKDNRNTPSVRGTSRLSPHLAFGEISPRQLWHDIHSSKEVPTNDSVACYLSEIGWREFSYYLLFHFPDILNNSFNPKFDHFNWRSHYNDDLKAWQQGQTGYPLIDAGMRELWQTGYMHNRVRMVVASFLCKHLLIHWKEGAKWFWDTLVDADLASNTASWQWVAGCGADATPYFRIFNPVTQGEKFDAEGEYTRYWVPELKHLPKKHLHHPWDAPKEILSSSKITLGENYPLPIVDHKAARELALLRYGELKQLPL